MFKFTYRLLKYALMTALGLAAAAKLVLQSNAGPETEEIDMVSVFEGTVLVSTAQPFYGGKILGMFSGVVLDVRKATPSPTGIHLDLAVVFGGVSLVVPEGWRVRSEVKVVMGGFADHTRTTADPDVPTVTLSGFVVMGGVQASSKPLVEVVF